MITVRYTKAQYMARITELEGYHGQLQQHLEKLEELREQVFVFWEDANAEKIGKILDIQIRQVQNSMDRTHDLLIFYKSAVEKLDGANLDVGQVLEAALGTLAGPSLTSFLMQRYSDNWMPMVIALVALSFMPVLMLGGGHGRRKLSR